MCYVCWSVNAQSLLAGRATPVAALADPPRQDILDLQPPALSLSVLLLSPISPCSSHLSPSPVVCLRHLSSAAGDEKTKNAPSTTQGAFFQWWQQLCDFSKYSFPSGSV